MLSPQLSIADVQETFERLSQKRDYENRNHNDFPFDFDITILPRTTQGMIRAMQDFNRTVGFKDKIVLDVFSGDGSLSRLAKGYGAKRVYAVSGPYVKGSFPPDIDVIEIREEAISEGIPLKLKDLPDNLTQRT